MIRVNVVLDESGSMESICQETIDGYNTYIKELRESGNDMTVSLTKFNSLRVSTLYTRVPIHLGRVPKLTVDDYRPDGMTPLYDAIAKAIGEVGPADGDAVLFVIITDGLENASTTYTRSLIQKLIAERQEQGWTFAYLGANQDAWEVGQQMGYHQGNVQNWDPNQAPKAWDGLSQATVCYAAAMTSGGKGYSADKTVKDFYGTEFEIGDAANIEESKDVGSGTDSGTGQAGPKTTRRSREKGKLSG